MRHAEPSWFFNGQTTSFWASETEKELVKEFLGGIVTLCQASSVKRARTEGLVGSSSTEATGKGSTGSLDGEICVGLRAGELSCCCMNTEKELWH